MTMTQLTLTLKSTLLYVDRLFLRARKTRAHNEVRRMPT